MKRTSSGLASLEFVLLSWFFVVWMSGLLLITQGSLLRQKTLMVARLGTFLQVHDLLSDDTIRNFLRSLLDEKAQFTIGPFRGTPASRFYDLVYSEVHVSFRNRLVTDRVVMHRLEKQD